MIDHKSFFKLFYVTACTNGNIKPFFFFFPGVLKKIYSV